MLLVANAKITVGPLCIRFLPPCLSSDKLHDHEVQRLNIKLIGFYGGNFIGTRLTQCYENNLFMEKKKGMFQNCHFECGCVEEHWRSFHVHGLVTCFVNVIHTSSLMAMPTHISSLYLVFSSTL